MPTSFEDVRLLRKTGSRRRRFEPSSSPSASQYSGAVASWGHAPKICGLLPMLSFGRTQRKALGALDRAGEGVFSPQPSYHVRRSEPLISVSQSEFGPIYFESSSLNQGYELQLRNSTPDSSTLASCPHALIDCVDLGDFGLRPGAPGGRTALADDHSRPRWFR